MHEHQGGRKLHRRRRKTGDESRQNASRHQRQQDLAGGAQFRCAEIFGGLFQRDRDLLQGSVAGAQGIGEAAHGEGEHDHDPHGGERTPARQLHIIEGAQKADAQHHAGDGEGGARGPIEPGPADQLRAQHQIGDGSADDDVDEARQGGVDQGVLDIAKALAEDPRVMGRRVGVRQGAEGPDGGEGEQQQAHMGRQHQHEDQQHGAIGDPFFVGLHLAFGEAAAAALFGIVVLARHGARREPHAQHGHDHQHHGNHIAHGVGDADGGHAQIGLGGQHVLHAEEQGRGQIIQHLHEDQRGAGDIAGHGQRQDDAAEEAKARASQILRRLLHAAVDVAHGGGEIDEDEGEIVDGLHEDHAIQPLHEGDLEIKPFIKQQVDRAVAAKQQQHGDSPHEGRHDQRQKGQGLDERRAAKVKTRGDIGQRQGDEGRDEHRHAGGVDGVPEGADEEIRAREIHEVDEREGARALLGEGDIDDGGDRQRQKDHQKGGDPQRQGDLPRRGGGLASGLGQGAQGRLRHRLARELDGLLRLGARLFEFALGEGRPLLLQLRLPGALFLAAGEGAGDFRRPRLNLGDRHGGDEIARLLHQRAGLRIVLPGEGGFGVMDRLGRSP